MTLQQLKYIIAIDRQRNFAKAAEQCGISQPTLSAMLMKLEEELDVRIFERNNKNVIPTTTGEKIIQQAERALAEAERITELVSEDKGMIAGKLTLSVDPTIAPYILPKFIKKYTETYPTIHLNIHETKTDAIAWILTWIHLENRLFHAIFTTRAAILAWILEQNKTARHLRSCQSLIYFCLGCI